MKHAKIVTALGICSLLTSCGNNQGYLPAQSGDGSQQPIGGQQQGTDQSSTNPYNENLPTPIEYEQKPSAPAPSPAPTPSSSSSTGGGGRS